jgi:hypothetical protein
MVILKSVGRRYSYDNVELRELNIWRAAFGGQCAA